MRATGNQEGDGGVSAIGTLTRIAGLYLLTADGELGLLEKDKAFAPERALGDTFGPQIRQLLRSYLAYPDRDGVRLGLVYRATEHRPWGSDTLRLEEAVLRELYPVGGPPAQELTAFQKKNREKSIYRGIELLIEYRHEQQSDAPVYCPLLFDRGTMLEEYETSSARGTHDMRTPVLEVLNLLAVVPLGRRNAPELAALLENMHRYLVRKDARREDGFSIRKERYVAPQGQDAGAVEFFDVDKRHERQQTFADGIARRLAEVDQVQRADRFDQVEQWLERPNRPVDAALLRTFAQFRDLDAASLATLAAKALVYTAPGGVKLLDVGMKDPWSMYLLEGTVSLQAADGGSLFVTGGTAKAASPISFLKPRKYTVSAVTSVSFLWIHDALLDAVLVPPGPAPRAASALKPEKF